jgi:hypothetical protein
MPILDDSVNLNKLAFWACVVNSRGFYSAGVTLSDTKLVEMVVSLSTMASSEVEYDDYSLLVSR